MTRLFSYGPFRPFSSLSSAQYLQYTPSSKVETALKNPHKKLGNHFKTASQQRMQIHSLLLAVSFSLIANSYIRKSRARNESPPLFVSSSLLIYYPVGAQAFCVRRHLPGHPVMNYLRCQSLVQNAQQNHFNLHI